LLPLPCALLLYGESASMWVAFVAFAVLGATDFVDGMMARREGPTKLGGLIDPVADKIFIAAAALALAGMGLVPSWTPAAIMSREFLMTVLRSSLGLRRESIKTSTLGKMKTVIQMGGFGTIFLTLYLTKTETLVAAVGLFALMLGIGVGYAAARKKWPPFWVIPVGGAFVYWFALTWFFSQDTSILLQIVVIVAITWASAFDYIVGTYRIFLRTGIHNYDVARIFWALAHSFFSVSVVIMYPSTALLILVSISFELALGGVDNVVAAEKLYAGKRPFVVTGIAAMSFALAAYGTSAGLWSAPMVLVATLLAIISIASFVATYRKWAHLFARVLD
jgi:cardiolipin synthase